MDADPRDASIEQLTARMAELEARLVQLLSTNERQARRIRELEEQLAALQAESARQAAPFRREPQRRTSPDERKRPGRPPGHPGAYRVRPDKVDATVRVPLTACPRCGGPVTKVRPRTQFIVEIPPLSPTTTQLVTECGRCASCGRVCSGHEMQSSAAEGAAGTHLGPRALALAALLNKNLCLPMRKTCRLLRDLLGLSLTPGGLSQAVERVADRLGKDWERLLAQVREAPAAYADETGWWMAGDTAWLWTFATERATVFVIDPRRSRDVVTETLGPRFGGVLVSDCLAAYERMECRMQKCLAHHLRAVRKAMLAWPDSTWLPQVKAALQQGIELKRIRGPTPDEAWNGRRSALEADFDRLLGDPPRHREELSVFNRLRKRRGSLTTFLDVKEVDATNNRAERALRPMVVARKLSAGNRSRAGATALQTIMSVGVTWAQQGLDFVDTLTPKLRLEAATAR
jgi:transposase